MNDATRRFTGRVENYVRYGPGYPPQLLGLLRRECGLRSDSVVADIGFGTGILAKLFLENGNRVLGVEPNEEMRRAGERLLGGSANFVSVPATAESTTLDDGDADFVTAGQSFHWFEPEATRAEFARILRPGGWVVLVWRTRDGRRERGRRFMEAYERLLETYGTDYEEVAHGRRGSPEEVRDFFAPGVVEETTFGNRQVLDLEGLKGRALPSSYVPSEGEPGHAEMMEELGRIYRAREQGGTVTVEYDTRVYYGRLGGR